MIEDKKLNHRLIKGSIRKENINYFLWILRRPNILYESFFILKTISRKFIRRFRFTAKPTRKNIGPSYIQKIVDCANIIKLKIFTDLNLWNKEVKV